MGEVERAEVERDGGEGRGIVVRSGDLRMLWQGVEEDREEERGGGTRVREGRRKERREWRGRKSSSSSWFVGSGRCRYEEVGEVPETETTELDEVGERRGWREEERPLTTLDHAEVSEGVSILFVVAQS